MKTITQLGSNYNVYHRQQDSENNQSSVRNTIANLGKKLVKSLHDLRARLLKFDTNSQPQI